MIADRAFYVGGKRKVSPPEPCPPEKTSEDRRAQRGMSWVELHDPTAEEVLAVAEEFGASPLVAESSGGPQHRPRLERMDGLLSVVLRTARYVDESETVEFGEIQVLAGPGFVVTIGRGEYRALGEARRRLDGDPDGLRRVC